MRRRVAFIALAIWGGVAGGAEVSEEEYFSELPVVLSVSRLAQPLNETPGAVTVLDRDMIRRSGARSVAELLRLVPGFIVGHYEGAGRPVASYHAEYDDLHRHLQVFIDGRSTYSSLLLGSANYGMMGVVLEDVERIEVLRGSNSAAHGANAFLGVVNVITRHAADTLGGQVTANLGETNLRDATARIGWGDEKAAYRVSVARRGDSGFRNLHDDSRIFQGHFRGDLHPTASDDLMLAAGHAEYRWGVPGSSSRDEAWDNAYAQAQWIRRVDEDRQWKLRAQVDTEAYHDFYPNLRADGRSRRLELEAEQSLVADKVWRFVWGGQYRYERVESVYLFAGAPEQDFKLWRVFGNAEWRPHPQWLVNAGGLWEQHSIAGRQSAPRVMVHFHALPGHTLRLGTTSAHKQPTLFELRADWRNAGTPAVRATGKARAESIEATEFGYLGQFQALGVTADVRVFEEKVRDLMRFQRPCGGCPNDVVNKDPNTQRGWETQLRWQPWSGTQILFNHTELRLVTDLVNTAPQDQYRAPRRFSTLAWFQRLPDGWDLSVIHTASEAHFAVRLADMIPAYRQTDVRLARNFRIGPTRVETSLMVQAVDGSHVDYVLRNTPPMILGHRAHLGLRFEF